MSDQHLDDEVLSAVLDGEATPEESAHADACAECGPRLETLRQASLLVRTPVEPPADDERERALAAALAAHNVVALQPRRRRVPPPWLAAAAAFVVVAGAVVLATRDSDDADDVASGGADSAQVADEDAATMSMAMAPVEGGDLGEIDVDALQEIVQGALASGAGAGATGGGSAEREEADDAATTMAAPAPEAGDAVATGGPSCEDSIRAQHPQLAGLVYRASGTLDDEPVGVYAFDVVTDDGTVDRWVFVTSVDDCSVRNQQTFEA